MQFRSMNLKYLNCFHFSAFKTNSIDHDGMQDLIELSQKFIQKELIHMIFSSNCNRVYKLVWCGDIAGR